MDGNARDFADASVAFAFASAPTTIESRGTNFVDLARSVKDNALAPALNSLTVEPVNAGLTVVNGLSHCGTWVTNKVFGTCMEAPQVGKLSELSVGKVTTGSVGYYSQEAFGTAGSFLAYAIAGKLAGKTLKVAGELAPAEFTIAKMQTGAALQAFAHDTRVATVLGATGYAGLKDPHAGESRLSNAVSTFVSFSAFETGNSLIDAKSPLRFGERYLVGSLGGNAQANVASLIQEHKLAGKDAVNSGAIAGGLLNSIMPTGRHLVDRTETKIDFMIGERKESHVGLRIEGGELPPELPRSQTTDIKQAPAPLTDTLAFVRSGESLIGSKLTDGQRKLLDQLEASHNAATKLDGVEPTSRQVFAEPTKLTNGSMIGSVVTSVTEYATGIKVYENPGGITREGLHDHGFPTRMISDHATFVKKEFDGQRVLDRGVGGGATVESVYEFHDGGAAYVNESGLFGPKSERALLQSKHSRLRIFDKAGEAELFKPDPKLDLQIAKIVEKFSAAKADARVEKLIEQMPQADRPYARSFLELSQPALDGSRMMAHYREVGQQALDWFELNKGPNDYKYFSRVHPAADDSAGAFQYIASKLRSGVSGSSSIMERLNQSASSEQQPGALVLFGDVTKMSAEELSALQSHQKRGLKLAIFDNQFDRGVNAIDFHQGTAKLKLEALTEAAKLEQARKGLAPEEASWAVLNTPAETLSNKLNAPILGRKSSVSHTSSTPEAGGQTSQVLAARIKQHFHDNYLHPDDQLAIAEVYANEIRFYDLPEMLKGIETLHGYIGDVGSADKLYVVDQGKSQELISFLYQRVNGVDPGRFVTFEQFEKMSADELKGKTIVLLDDAAYTGAQIESNIGKVQAHTACDTNNPVVVANLAAYKEAYQRTDYLENKEIVSTESILPFYQIAGIRAETYGSENGITGKIAMKAGSLSDLNIEFLRKASLFEFSRGGTWGKIGNRLIFFYKRADSTPTFIGNFLEDHFHIGF